MVNCNPETVSTDYDTSDRLYFEPLTLEDVLGVVEVERPEGVIVQFGGQTPLKLAAGTRGGRCPAAGHPASTRSTWPRTAGASASCWTASAYARAALRHRPFGPGEALEPRRPASASRCSCGPSYVLGGRAMEIVYDARGAGGLPRPRGAHGRSREIFLDRFLENAIEVDVDALCDGEDVWVGGIMQHVEEAGIHSGDSACVLPPHSLGGEMLERDPRAHAGHRARAGGDRAAQRPVCDAAADELYVIEANPRASRTVPFVSKATGIPLAKMACRIMLGERIVDPRPARRVPWRPATWRSRRPCCPSTASRARTPCWAPRCARPARSWGWPSRLPHGVRQGAGCGGRGAAAPGPGVSSR